MKKLFAILLFAGVISFIPSSLHPLFSSSLIAQIPSEGLVAWYPFNGNANDESGNGNNGTVNGATLTMDRNETANAAYSFDGTLNDIIQSNLPVMNNSFCITGWYKSNYPTTYYPRIFYYGNSPLNQVQTGFGMVTAGIMGNEPSWISNYTGKFYQEVNINNTAVWSLDNTINGSWHFFTVQYDLTDQNLTMHIDGVFNTAVNVGVNAINSGQLTIGNSPQNAFGGCTGCGSFNGLVDDVAIYNRALSSSEIQQLYQDQTGQVQQPLTCNITAPVTSICAGESVTLSVNTTGSAGSSSQLPANLQQGLVAYYPFNGNANDESGNGNNGTVNGATLTADRFGNVNGAYSFNSNYIEAPLQANFQNFTLSLWIKTSLNIRQIPIIRLHWNDAGQEQFGLALSDLIANNVELVAKSDNPNCTPGLGWNHLNSSVNFYDNQFHHIVATCFGNHLKLYFDSQLVGEYFMSNTLSDCNSGSLQIGRNWIGDPAYFHGDIDDILLYNREISNTEIQQLYTSQSFAWNTGATTNSITVTPTMDTTYSCTVTQGNSTCTASVDITVNPAVTNAISASIVEGQSYTLGTQTLTTEGTYTEVFTSTAGCDSTVTLTLSVEPLLTCNITSPTSALCAGESVNLSVNASGECEITPNLTNLMFLTNYEGHDYYLYTDFLSWEDAKTYGDQNGLSMYIMNSAAEANAIYATLPFLGVDNVHYWIGLYQDLNDPSYSEPSGGWKWVDGTNLNSGYSNWATGEPNDASPGEHYAQFEWSNYGLQWNDAGFPAQNGTQYSLTIYELGGGNLTNASFSWSNNATEPTISVSLTTNTTYSCTVTSGTQTCTASIDITVNPAVTNAISANIIEGQSYTLGNQTLTTAGTYTEVFTSATGCDSTVTLTLAVEPLLTCNITAPVTTICEGESVTLSVNTTGGAGSSSQLPANLQQGLVAYYPFNGNANDESGNGNHGTVNGATLTSDRFGNVNSAYSFNGLNTIINCNSTLGNFGTGDFSISSWVKNNNANTEVKVIVGKRNAPGYGNFFEFGTKPLGYFYEFNANSSGDLSYTNGVGMLSESWDLVTFLRQGSYLKIYQNGILIQSFNTGAIHAFSNDAFFTIGGRYSGTGLAQIFDGDIDDVIVFNRALSLSEIQQLYTSQSFSWNTGATTNSITVTPTMDTTYSCTVTQGNSTCTASVDITVNPAVTNAISASIVEGQSYTLGTQTLTTAGTYTEVFTSATGCDSTVTLTLAVEPLLTCNITAPVTSICAGESATLSVNTTGGVGSSSQLPANLQQGLVAYYPFNGNANDESGNGNDGSPFGGPLLVQDKQGAQNSAYSFDGVNDAIEISAVDAMMPSNLTISFWMRPNFNALYGHVIRSRFYGYIFYLNNGTLNFQLHNSWPESTWTNSTANISNWNPNEWHHITGTFDGFSNKLYVDGNLVAQVLSTVSSIVYSSDGLIVLGRDGNTGNVPGASHYSGDLDEVMFYDIALSPAEIQQLYTSQSYSWNTGAITNSITVTPTANTTYSCTVTQGTQTCTDSIAITVNPALTWYADADGDGFGNPNAVVLDCNQPAGYVTDNTDCNDAVASAYPGGEEICGNNIDEDCNGQDSICFVAVLGCTNANACNFNPLANTDDNSCILPQPEVCDGLDNNCNNQIDEGFTIPTINPVAVTPALYPTCTGNALKSADFNAGTNSPIIDGNGPDLWYSFTAQFNTLRVGLSAAFGDNSIGLYTMNNGCLELITEEHEVYTATTLATGNQILLSDQLTVGQTYYVAVHQITGPTNTSAKVCFTYLNGSSRDHYYSNNTGVYTSVCNSFKAQYRANATNYIFNVLSGTQNGVNMNLTPWSYTNNNSNTVVARLGSILPANHSGVSRVYTLAVPVVYGLTDAAGNVSNLLANTTTNCAVTLNSEATIALRQADRCPATKSITATIAPDRSVCGAIRYDWEFTEVLPAAGTAQVVQGGAYASVFFLSNVPGVAAGKTYNVRVRPVHSSGVAGNWGSVQCLRIGNAGMILENHPVQTAQALVRTPLLSLRAGGEMSASYSIYPNPTATGSFVLQYNGSRRGESIFAQEPTTTESTIAQETTMESTVPQEPTTMESISARELVMLDITGKVVFKTNVVLNGSPVEIKFGDLASGVYVVMVGEERIRLIIE